MVSTGEAVQVVTALIMLLILVCSIVSLGRKN
jgi:hypothetical protein